MSSKGSITFLVFLSIIGFLSQRRIFKYLKSRYSGVQLVLLNNVIRARGRYNSVLYNVKFLQNCLKNSVAPKGIQRRVRKSRVHHSAVIERAFIRDELEKSRLVEIRTRDKFRRLYKQAKSILNVYDFIRFSWLISECDCRQRNSLQERYNDSIKRLRQERFGLGTNNYNTLLNLANVELNTLQKEVLCRGVDFGIVPRISEPNILAEFELLQRQASQFVPISKADAERSKYELAAVAQEFATTKPDDREFCLKREHRKVLKELRGNKELIITRPDKGRATVILSKNDYVAKMMKILSDSSKFERLGPSSEFDHTLKTEHRLQSYLKSLLASKEIAACVYNDTLPTGSVRPRLYGLPKVHKPGVPLRPILSMSGSPQYAISKWLCEILKPVVEHYGTRCVKDSFTFSDSVKRTKLSYDGYMCSFDVVSLFTNVPLKEVIDICADAIYRNDQIETEPTSLTEKSFRRLMELATSDVEFSFDGIMYRQIDGVAMGSPLGPTLANIFVGYCEKQIPEDEWPEMYCRYVDDAFAHFVTKDNSEHFLHLLNGLHPALHFTCEGEQQGSLPFLDVKVRRVVDGIETAVYRKPTFTGLYTPWDSYSPTRYKINLVRSLVHRAQRICSPATLMAELDFLRSVFLKNGYPGHVLDQVVTPTNTARDRIVGPRPCPILIRLPWIGKKSGELLKRTNTAVRLAYFAVEVHAVYSTSRAFSLPKDVLPTPSISNVVYLYECRQCESRYVGKTSQHLSERIRQHVPRHLVEPAPDPSQKRKRGRPPKLKVSPSDYQSAIACHLAANDRCREKYCDGSFSILARARSQQHLNVLESMYIRRLNPVLCKQKMSVTNLLLFPSVKE